jgi:predicted O-methyltransferase YrrM
MVNELEEYMGRVSMGEPDILVKLWRETHLTQVYPQMMAGHIQGLLLRMIVGMLRPHRVLEIGTFTGYSAIAMGLGMEYGVNSLSEDVRIHTIESNVELEEGIRRYISDAGLEPVIHLHIGDAATIIPTLEESWDLVYIDADKPGYLNYYQLTLPKVRKGGFILADNVLWDGKVLDDPSVMDKDTRGIVEFNEFVRQDSRVENLLLPLRDGMMLIRKL